MTEPDFERYAAQHLLGDQPIPTVVLELAHGVAPALVWRNDLGGLTFRIADRFVKWNPTTTSIDLALERDRLLWIRDRHPAPAVIDWGENDEAQWMVTAAMPGDCAVGDEWRRRRPEAIRAIATGLRTIHAVPIDDVPGTWEAQAWQSRRPARLGTAPPVDDPVLVHGDACAPNTLIDDLGTWIGHVDLGDLGIGDRWGDLAIASLSLDWNFGEGHQGELFEAYGIEPDIDRIEYYRALWHAES